MSSDRPDSRTIRIAAAVITDASGRLLLVRKRGAGAFMQPGGKIEPGEPSRAALARELREELGLAVDPSATAWLGRFSALAANEPGFQVEADLFSLPLSGEPMPAAEIEEMIWFDPAAVGTVELAPLTRDLVLRLVSDRADEA
ncbi:MULTISPECIES: NUDIX domain-containing protein [unclassified Mesorhizobium]|uniref:NUDIX hydrolase n=1 Tax=unclassified Mesorhizobium TaxID=325217 RepID=UPI00095F4ADF|nr:MULTISPECIES: NUDIX domain-containing protein [unclassified Mesorhizobium]OJX82071.1 MAG: DNA mismatch repair protein MutT [Mesorhizobium sp. 65-26]